MARGADAQTAVDEFAPPSSARHRVEHRIGEYLDEQVELVGQGERSPAPSPEIERCGRPAAIEAEQRRSELESSRWVGAARPADGDAPSSARYTYLIPTGLGYD